MMIQKLIDTSHISSDACCPPLFTSSYDHKQITSEMLQKHREKPSSRSISIGASPKILAKL